MSEEEEKRLLEIKSNWQKTAKAARRGQETAQEVGFDGDFIQFHSEKKESTVDSESDDSNSSEALDNFEEDVGQCDAVERLHSDSEDSLIQFQKRRREGAEAFPVAPGENPGSESDSSSSASSWYSEQQRRHNDETSRKRDSRTQRHGVQMETHPHPPVGSAALTLIRLSCQLSIRGPCICIALTGAVALDGVMIHHRPGILMTTKHTGTLIPLPKKIQASKSQPGKDEGVESVNLSEEITGRVCGSSQCKVDWSWVQRIMLEWRQKVGGSGLVHPVILVVAPIRTETERHRSLNATKHHLRLPHFLHCSLQPCFSVDFGNTALYSILSDTFSKEGSKGSNDPPLLRLMVIGAQSTGKSTHARAITNALLSVTSSNVLWLDMDVGQGEFQPPGFFGLYRIKGTLSMCDGATEVPNDPATIECLRLFYIGSTVIWDVPAAAKAVVELCDFASAVQLDSSEPLVVNTHGWVHSSGRRLTLEVFFRLLSIKAVGSRNVRPHIVHLLQALSDGWFGKDQFPAAHEGMNASTLLLPCIPKPNQDSRAGKSKSKKGKVEEVQFNSAASLVPGLPLPPPIADINTTTALSVHTVVINHDSERGGVKTPTTPGSPRANASRKRDKVQHRRRRWLSYLSLHLVHSKASVGPIQWHCLQVPLATLSCVVWGATFPCKQSWAHHDIHPLLSHMLVGIGFMNDEQKKTTVKSENGTSIPVVPMSEVGRFPIVLAVAVVPNHLLFPKTSSNLPLIAPKGLELGMLTTNKMNCLVVGTITPVDALGEEVDLANTFET